MSRDQGMKVQVVDGVLTVSIGVDALKRGVETSPDPRLTVYNEETGEFEYTKVGDAEGFARDIARELEREEEDGTTPLHILFDNAAVDAVEDGSEHVVFSGEE